MEHAERSSRDTERMTTGSATLARLVWMMLGPILLSLLALLITQERSRWLSFPSAAYITALGGTMLGRWIEFRLGNPLTSTGEPATGKHLRAYLLMTTILGLSAWIVANLLASS